MCVCVCVREALRPSPAEPLTSPDRLRGCLPSFGETVNSTFTSSKKTKQKCTVKDKTEHFLSNQIHIYLSSVERGLTAAPATTSVSSFKRSKLCRRSTPVHLKRFLRAVLNFCLLVSVLHRGKINSRQALEPRGGSCF